MSWCLSGASRTTFVLDLDIVKSTSTSYSTTSSPSSTLSESSNIRKPRTPRKRPNQIYNEAAVLLSSVHPTIFPTKPFPKNAATSLTSNAPSLFFHDVSSSSSDLLLPCPVTDHFGFHVHTPSSTSYNYNRINSFNNLPESSNNPQLLALGNCDGYFDQTSSVFDEEMESVEGIDSIMGVVTSPESQLSDGTNSVINGVPHGLGFAGLMMRRGVPALRQVDRGDWWRFPAIDMCQISPRLSSNNLDSSSSSSSSKRRRRRRQHKSAANAIAAKKNIKKQDLKPSDTSLEDISNIAPSLMLKLNYKEVVNAWSDRGPPFDEPDMFRPNAHVNFHPCNDVSTDRFIRGGSRDERSKCLTLQEKASNQTVFEKGHQVSSPEGECRFPAQNEGTQLVAITSSLLD